MIRRTRSLTVLMIVLTMASSGAMSCAGNRVPILVAQSGLAVAQSIGAIQTATKNLTDATVLPPAAALQVQEKLLAINTKLMPLPDLLRRIDAAQQAADPTVPLIDQVIAVLQTVGGDITVVLAGVPVNQGTQAVIDLVRAAQTAVQTVLVEVARVKGAQN